MGTFVMLGEPGGEIYIAWSTTTGGPCAYGLYAEIHAHLMEDHSRTSGEADRQLRRAGQFGSSSLLEGAWGDHALICQGRNVDGLLPRRDLVAYARAVCRGTEAEDSDTADALLQPENSIAHQSEEH